MVLVTEGAPCSNNGMISRYLVCVVSFVALGLLNNECRAEKPLNIVFILADDLGFMDIRPNNPKSFYDTPHLQELADTGMRFTQGYAACPVCSPTRSSIMTGQYPARTRNTDYFNAPNEYLREVPSDYDPVKNETQRLKLKRFTKSPLWPAPYVGNLAPEHTTLAEAFKEHGYGTFFAGKWHLGKQGSWPEDHGFDVNKGGIDRGGPYGGKKYFSPYGNPRLEDGPDGEHLPDRLASETAKFIADQKGKPFLAYLSFYSVHTPLIGRPDLVEKYKKRKAAVGATEEAIWGFDKPRKVRHVQEHAVYGAMVEAMDLAVGKVLQALEDNGVIDHTIVIFFSDNGGLSTSEGWPTSNLPYRAGKGWLYEGGIREPMLVRWPGVTKAGSVCSTPIVSTDFYPTLLEACGMAARPKQHLDGISFAPLLKNPGAKIERSPLFWHYAHWGNQGGIPGSVIRDGDWKLIDFYWEKGAELYNIAEDPAEAKNIAAEQPEKTKALLAKLNAWRKSVDAIPPTRNPGFEGTLDKW
jgi:arylsulfatase A-like enzyme